MGDALLGAQERDDLLGRVERDPEARGVEVGHRLAEAGLTLVARVLVRGRVSGTLGERLHDVVRRGQIGVADAETDDVDPRRPAFCDLLFYGGEQVWRQRPHAFGDPHRPPCVRTVSVMCCGRHSRWARNSRERSPR